jgi:hypothetical protein
MEKFLEKGGWYCVNEEIVSALMRRVRGYRVKEVVEEYGADEDGGEKLLKRKVNSKHVPPDVAAAKILNELFGEKGVIEMTDGELEKEKKRLLKELKNGSNCK